MYTIKHGISYPRIHVFIWSAEHIKKLASFIVVIFSKTLSKELFILQIHNPTSILFKNKNATIFKCKLKMNDNIIYFCKKNSPVLLMFKSNKNPANENIMTTNPPCLKDSRRKC